MTEIHLTSQKKEIIFIEINNNIILINESTNRATWGNQIIFYQSEVLEPYLDPPKNQTQKTMWPVESVFTQPNHNTQTQYERHAPGYQTETTRKEITLP